MSTQKKNILIICFTDTRFDARVARQIDFLKDEYNVSFAGHGIHLNEGVEFIEIPSPPLPLQRKARLAALLISRNYDQAYWYQYPFQSLKKKLQERHFDLILANDIESLPLAFWLAEQSSARILFDAHEYAPRHFEDRLYWRMFFQRYYTQLCEAYIPQIDGMLTVCDGLAREYQKNFKILPEILTNAPVYQEITPTPTDPQHIRLIHHGIVNKSRKIENMIEMMDYVDERFSLDIMVKTTETSSRQTLKYFDGLKAMAAKRERVRFIPPVSSREIVALINQYDMGVFILEPLNFNYRHALPNKLFDFIQARLAVAVSPSIEMEKVVKQYQLGIVAEDFTARSMAEQLNRLSYEDIVRFKQNSHAVARKLSAEENKQLLLRLINSILEKES